jgi:SPOR domain
MSASGSRAGDEINLEEFERRLRAAGAQQARAEDPLAELSRLVEFSHFGISNGGTSARRVAEPKKTSAESAAEPVENAALRPSIDEEMEELAPGSSEADREARQDYEFDAHGASGASAGESAEERRPMRWKLAVSGLALAGVAMIGAVFALKGEVPGLPKQPPFIAAAQGPTKVAPPSDETVTASGDAGGSLLKDNAKPGSVKVVNSEEQPVDLSAQASFGNAASIAANPPAGADQAKPPAASDPTALAATVNTPLVALPGAPPPAMPSEFPDPKPVRTVSLRPDGTPIAGSPPDQAGSDAKSAAPPPAEAPSKPAAKTATETSGVAQPSTPKLDLPAKPSAKSSARVVVAKTDTTAPDPNSQTLSPSTQNGASAKPEKTAKKPKPREVADATETTGAIAQPPIDATAATTSGGWSVQLAAPKSEAEANSKLAQLNSKYAAQLNGSSIGVHKAVVKGETIYRLRVVGLTKADAAALCARLKGDGGECFIAK